MISQGTYGCIFKNSEETQEKTKQKLLNPEDEYITKIQKKEETSDNEKEIGVKIMAINHYKNYFAPVTKSEDVNIKLIDQDEIDKCDFVKNEKEPNTKYESEKIKYVGEDSLLKYYSNIISTNNRFIFIFIENHIILLEALEKLMSSQIIHYDLKENNIIIQDTDKRPIIIDFGLSIDTTKPMESHFYRYYTQYGPWCIDIVFLSYMVKEIGPEWQTKSITSNDITKVINEYYENNPVVLKLLSKDEQTKWKTNTLVYFNQYINKPWQLLYDELIKYCFTWDNYSINIMYLYIFNVLELITYSNNTFLNKYVELIKKAIMSIPSERELPDQTKKSILILFESMNRNDLNTLQYLLKMHYTNNKTIQEVEKNTALSIIEDKNKEKIIESHI